MRLAILPLALALAAPALAQGDTAATGSAKAQTSSGEQTYREICAACHMNAAQGSKDGAKAPALARNTNLADNTFVLNRLWRGKGGMPAFADILSAEQVAAVATYIRSHFGNAYAAAITAQDAKRLMPPKDSE
jgi:mono/diheme cytochrome c family protein